MIKNWNQRSIKVNGKTFFPLQDVLIFDIETRKKDINKSISASNSELVAWGAYSYKKGKLIIGKDGGSFQDLVNDHKIIIGWNIKDFDIPIMEKECNISFEYKVIGDLLELLRPRPPKSEVEAMKKQGKKPQSGKGRAAIIGELRQKGMIDNRFPNYKLGTVVKHFYKIFKNHPVYGQFCTDFKDEEFEYSKIQPKQLSPQVWEELCEYLRKDIIVTKNVFELLERYFESFAEFISEKDLHKLQHILTPTGTFAYKAICKELNLEEVYGKSSDSFIGALVLDPLDESFGPEDGDGYCIDFNSQHPSHVRSMNLATPVEKCLHKVNGKCPTAHSGDGKIFKLLGTYCACEQGPIEKLLTKWYLQRLEYKKNNDPREYTIKILINTVYGIFGSSVFESIYNKNTAQDTTRMSQQSISFMKDWMTKAGYKVVSGDTDSLYIMDPFRDKQRMIKVKDEGIAEIKKVLPFVDEYYAMGIDAEFTHIFFFKDEEDETDEGYKKKNYIYIKKDGSIKLNGLPIMKSNASKLAKKIYINHLESEIKRTKTIKFDREWLSQLINYEIEQNITILAVRYNCKPAKSYASSSQIQCALSERYLNGNDGELFVIKHLREGLGVGKGKFYCNLEEAKKLKFREFDLDTVWKSLDPFIKKAKQFKLYNYG